MKLLLASAGSATCPLLTTFPLWASAREGEDPDPESLCHQALAYTEAGCFLTRACSEYRFAAVEATVKRANALLKRLKSERHATPVTPVDEGTPFR